MIYYTFYYGYEDNDKYQEQILGKLHLKKYYCV